MKKFSTISTSFSVLILLAAANLCLPAQAQAQGIAAQFKGFESIAPNGAFQYRIDLMLPEGKDGLKPSLAIAYNSDRGDGVMGPGFSLTGLPSIERCGKLRRIDGVNASVLMNQSDRLCLDGNPLILAESGKTYGQDGAVYRFESESFARVKSYGNKGAMPEYLIVERKNGQVETYGATDASRLTLGGALGGDAKILSWGLSSIQDKIGNVISIEYTKPQHGQDYRVSKVKYNGGKAEIVFSYKNRLISQANYLAGGTLINGLLLEKVDIYAANEQGVNGLARSYRLGYGKRDFGGAGTSIAIQERLDTVSLCDASNYCTDPISIQWNDTLRAAKLNLLPSATLSTDGKMQYGSDRNDSSNPIRFADLNADGIADMLAFQDDGVYAMLSDASQTSGFAASPLKVSGDFGRGQNSPYFGNTLAEYSPILIADMNRDGYSDIVGISSFVKINGNSNPSWGMSVSFWDPIGKSFTPRRLLPSVGAFVDWSFSNQWSPGGADSTGPRFLIDMNQDGYPDMVGVGPSDFYVSYWNGSSFTSATKVGSKAGWNSAAGQSNPFFIQDMDGDGFPDIVGVGERWSSFSCGTFLWQWDPKTSAFKNPVQVSTDMCGGDWRYDTVFPKLLADVNGDGLSDLVSFESSGVYVAIFDGTKFLPRRIWANDVRHSTSIKSTTGRTSWRTVDLNSDGCMDVISYSSVGATASISNCATGFAPGILLSSALATKGNISDEISTQRLPFDLYGDGRSGIVMFGRFNPTYMPLDGDGRMVVTDVTDSFGRRVRVKYSALQTNLGIYSALPKVWPDRAIKSSGKVVSRVETELNDGSFAKTDYQYEQGISNFEFGSLGFAKRREIDWLSEQVVEEEYHQVPYASGMIKKRQVSNFSAASSVEKVISGCETFSIWCHKTTQVALGSPLSTLSSSVVIENVASSFGSTRNPSSKFAYVSETLEKDLRMGDYAKQGLFEYKEPVLVAAAKQWGNQTKAIERIYSSTWPSGTLDTLRSEKISVKEYYAADEQSWTIGRLKKNTVTLNKPIESRMHAISDGAALKPGQLPPLPPPPSDMSWLPAVLQILLED